MMRLKRIICMFMALLLIWGMFPSTFTEVSASSTYQINGVNVRYDDYSSSPNECWAYANKIYKKIWGVSFNNSFSDKSNSLRNLSDAELKLTKDHLKGYVLNAALGSCLRICNSEYLHGSDGWGHSLIIVQKDSKGFTVFEGGLSSSPYCREKYYTWSEFVNTYSYEYIKYIKWPSAPEYGEAIKINLDNNGGTCATSSVFVTSGAKIGILPTPTKAGYDFAGWYKSGEYGLEPVTSSTTFSEDTTLYAHWANRQFSGYKITFDLNGGAFPVTPGGTVSNHHIDGINTARGSNQMIVYNCCDQLVNTNHWGVEVAVDANGKVIKKREYESDEQLTVPKGGFVLSGQGSWDKVGEYIIGISVGDYVAYDPDNMQVFIYTTTNHVLIDHKYASNENAIGTLPTPTKKGYDFAGWYISKDSDVDPVTSTSTFSENTTLYAHWANCLYEGNKITFDTNGGILPGAITSRSIDGINKSRGRYEMIVYNCGGDVVNTNHWGVEVAVGSNGKVIDKREYEEDNTLTVPEDGFVLSGNSYWGYAGEFVYNISIGDYVAYDESTMMVYVYDSENAYLANHKYVVDGNTYDALPVPSYGDTAFQGWYTAGGEKVASDSAYTTDTLYARWGCVHNYTSTTTPANCIEKGYTTHSCVNCGDTYVDSYVNAKGHSWDAGKVTKQPTETQTGIRTFTCSVCKQTKQETIPVLDHVHKYTGKVTLPSCTESGYTTYSCTCGESYQDDFITAFGHMYVKGVCTVCGAKDPNYVPEKFSLYGSSMTLGNALDMNFFVYQSDIEGTGSYAVITKHYADGRPDVTIRVNQANWSKLGSAFYYFTFNGVKAKEMADQVDVVIYNANGAVISEVFTDSVQGYARRMLDKAETPAKDKSLYIEMLNYGAAAQVEFKYDTGNLANSVISAAEQQAYGMKNRTYVNQRQNDAAYFGTTLTLENQIVFNIFYNGSYVPEGAYAVATFTNHKGEKMVDTVREFTALGNWKYASFKSLVVADCSKPITVKLYDANGKLISTVVDSVEGYAARMTSEGPLYVAIMKFADAAYQYFHS